MPDPSPVEIAQSRVGQALNAKWTLEKLLGVGGMGAVYAASHRNGARAAVKLLHAELGADPQLRERFLREGKIANRVDHPARVAVTDDDTSDLGEPFLVMELLEGETLHELRKRGNGRIALDETFRIFDVVLDLLAKCHAAGIVHRDIKPMNIFLTTAGEVKVLDFGVARMRDPDSQVEATRAGTAFGTPAYIAPEQALGLTTQIDGRSDLFSVGACMYTALSGERLNQARTEAESWVLAATKAAPSIANVAPELPVEVVAFVDRALAFERERRFQDAQSMRSELLGLAAAHRAGQLVASTLKKAQGLKTRGNEALDVAGDLSKDEIEAVHGRLAAVWKQIGICLSDVRQYGWSHPQATRALEVGYQQVTDALVAHPGNVRWDVGPGAFVFEGNAVWAPDRIPFDRVPYQLFADGVRRIQIKDGFTKEEFRDFVAILLHDVMGHESSEDDAVTALWDRRFEHVAYVAIEAFDGSSANDGPVDDTPLLAAADLAKEIAERAQLDRDIAVDMSLEGRAMQMNLAAQLKEAGEAAAALAIDPLTRATLGAQLNMSEEAWRERFVDAFADGYLEARPYPDVKLLHDALVEFREDQLKLHDHASLFALLEELEKALAARAPNEAKALEAEVARVVVPGATLGAILQELASGAAKESDANVAAGVAKALARLGDPSMLELACGSWGTTRSENLKNVLTAYIKLWARGNEARLGNLAATASPEVGAMCVALLAETGGVEALRAIESALRSPHLDVRIEALSRLPEENDELVRAEVRAMFENPASSVRTQALNLVAERELFAAGPAIVLTVQSPKFPDMPIDERRLWLRSLARLSPRRASEVCAGIVAEHKLVPTEAVETTRVLCAEVLAEVASSKEALEACVEASKKRWWNTQPVRDAAERALQQIEARIEAGVPEAATTGKRKKVVLE